MTKAKSTTKTKTRRKIQTSGLRGTIPRKQIANAVREVAAKRRA